MGILRLMELLNLPPAREVWELKENHVLLDNPFSNSHSSPMQQHSENAKPHKHESLVGLESQENKQQNR